MLLVDANRSHLLKTNRAIQAVVTIGVPRFLLNIRASYFSSTRNVPPTRTGCKRSTRYTETEGTAGTIGVFRSTTSDMKEEGDDMVGNEPSSIEMAIYNEPEV